MFIINVRLGNWWLVWRWEMNKAQQEMVGFVLIVVLVMVALMVFLVISLRKPVKANESAEIENLLSVLLKYTTECAIVYEPDYDNVKDLIKSCYENKKCKNLDKMACDYLNESLGDVMEELMATEAGVGAYNLNIFHDESGGMLVLSEGNCSGAVYGAQKMISVASGKIVIRLEFCY